MNDIAKIALGLTIPLLGTVLGSATVFFLRGEMNERLKKALLGFAAGVMTAASVWSLLLPSIEMARENGTVEWLPACVGFLFGIVFLLVLDTLIPHLHASADKPEGHKSSLGKSLMLFLAVTLHNVPEGIAVAVPIQQATGSRAKALKWSFLSGLAEPAGALIGFLVLMPFLGPVTMGVAFALVAGVMVFISLDELLPAAESTGRHHTAIYGLILGMAVMAVSLLLFL